MKRILIVSIIVSTLGLLGHAHAQFANAVIDYTTGTLNPQYAQDPFDHPNGVLGQPGGIIDAGTEYSNVFSPFYPHYSPSDLTSVGNGGQLTLRLENYVYVQAGAYEIGVWSNVGLNDADYPNGTNTTPVSTLSPASSAVVSVSADGTNWVALNNGSPITFSLPGNYYTNAGPYDTTAPANPQYANFGQPFTGSLSDFDGEDYSQLLATLAGSAGGTWLDLESTGLSEVGYIRFNGVASGDYLYLDGVGINSALAGGSAPEPGAVGLLALGAVLALGFGRRCRAGIPERLVMPK
jgi:hypothetical protein